MISRSLLPCLMSSRTKANGPRCRKLPPSARDAPLGTLATSSCSVRCLSAAPNPLFTILLLGLAKVLRDALLQAGTRSGPYEPRQVRIRIRGGQHVVECAAAPLWKYGSLRACLLDHLRPLGLVRDSVQEAHLDCLLGVE